MWKIGCCGLTIELPTNLAASRTQLPAPRLLLRTAIGPVNFTRSRGSFEVRRAFYETDASSGEKRTGGRETTTTKAVVANNTGK